MNPETDPFLKVWNTTSDVFLQKVRDQLLPEYQENGDGKAYKLRMESLGDVWPDFGTGFMYDAVLTAAMGTCIAWHNAKGTSFLSLSGMPIEAQVMGMRQVEFQGASGNVSFSDLETFFKRNPLGIPHVIINLWPRGGSTAFAPVDVMYATSNDSDTFRGQEASAFYINPIQPTIFANGQTTPPNICAMSPCNTFKIPYGLLVSHHAALSYSWQSVVPCGCTGTESIESYKLPSHISCI